MPRKVNRGVDYDEAYDSYDDYDYEDDNDYSVDSPAKVEEPQQKVKKLWSCSICTYDNEEGMSVCDICGVIRNPVAGDFKNSNKKTADSEGKCSGVSLLAKSLFGSLPHQTSQKAVVGQLQKDDLVMESRNDFHKSPSPDDMVSTRLQSSKLNTQGNVKPSTVAEDGNGAESVHSTMQRSEKSNKSKGKRGKQNASNSTDTAVNGNNFGKMSLSDKPGNSNALDSRKHKSTAEYHPDKWMLPDKANDTLTQLNLAIVGHVDSGKSTLSGRLLHLLGRITKKEMHKYEKDAKIQGKSSFAYAWALDESPEERERGITMNVAVAYFNSKKYHVVILDSPGHKDFVPNMISGATQADAAILVIDASNGAFEAGFDGSKGQTREHALLIRSFGVEQLIVAVNKMDVVGYSKDRFDLIVTQLGTFFRSCGFKESCILWIPLSAVENQNLVAAPSDARLLSWYRGPYLFDAIDSLQPPARDFAKPLLMPICDVTKSSSQGQVSVCGKLVAGALRSGLKVMVMPSGEVGTIKSLERDSQSSAVARAGDNVTINLQGIDLSNNVMPGGVVCHPDYPVAVARHLELKVRALEELAVPILNGSQVEFHIHHAQAAGKVAKILSILDPKSGKETKRSPRCLLSKQSAVIEVVLNTPVCVEEYSNCRALGRASLRAMGRTIAIGIVTRIIQ
ncbi:unnamed protein product [Linum tenue]|uniref:Tr-type G domain-containing protein n=1 Tax=Linum tenue TaxID=586396 RepID=A0AAV0LYZ6_9ROSI|nr:unnamed protein product [Linum tenue]